jgi:hypothetical protein
LAALSIVLASDCPPRARAVRLLLPWIAWSAVYVVLRRDAAPYGWATLLIGGSLHLWYLPFAFAASIALGRWTRSVDRRVWLAACGAASAASSFADVPAPFVQWIGALPAVFLGLWLRGRSPGAPDARSAAVVGWLVSVAGGVPAAVLAGGTPFTGGVGCALVAAAFAIRLRPSPAWASAATPCYVVYLTHPAWLWFWLKLGVENPAGLTALAVLSGVLSAAAWNQLVYRLSNFWRNYPRRASLSS